jgi:inosine-uridine nucleoside N-ribohydrolase
MKDDRQQSNGRAISDRVFGMKNPRAAVVLFAVLLTTCLDTALRSQSGSSLAKPSSSGAQLVVIDTDIGDDIDDAFALALALKSSELKILGVTTTFGNTEMRARLVDRYLKAVGRNDIPVFAGPATKTDNVMTQAEYAKGDPERKLGGGAEFILKEAREHPGQVTLIGIGPLSTVQAAIEHDPAVFKKLKRVVIMGGSIYRGYGVDAQGKPKPAEPEWNILNDPAGLKALLGSGVPVFMMPLDSTQVPLETKAREAIFSRGSALTSQLKLLYQEWMAGTANHSPTPTLFDPVAVTYTFRPDLCPGKPMHIDVDARGMTIPGQGAPNAQVCLESNERGFLDLLLKRIAAD